MEDRYVMPTREPKEPKLVEIQVDTQLTENIRQLHEVSSRIDERIKHLIEKQSGLSDKLEKLADAMATVAVRVAILEQGNVAQVRVELDEIDKKLAVLEKQMHNGLKSDVDSLKTKVHTLELANEHNTSFRTKGEVRLQWWLDMAWKIVQIVGAAALTYYLAKK